MQRALAFVIALLLLCNLSVVGVHLLDQNTDLVSGRSTVDLVPDRKPGRGQAFVTGVAEQVVAEGAQGSPLKTPLTIEAVERGVGRFTIEKALINNRRVTIVWDGGTPLPISGGGGLELGASRVEVNGKGVTWTVDGTGRRFQPGTYRLGSSVAVGSEGLATPRDGVEFTADDQTVVNARGNVVVRLDPVRLELQGPGRIDIRGRLEVQFPERKATGSSVRFPQGPFQVTIDPGDNRLQVNAVLQGEVGVS